MYVRLKKIGSKRYAYLVEGREQPRVEGELAALTIIAKKRVNEMFKLVGERTYRMRMRSDAEYYLVMKCLARRSRILFLRSRCCPMRESHSL